MIKFFNHKNCKTTILGAVSTILFALVSFDHREMKASNIMLVNDI
jgi:hypothetical protein